MTKKELKAISKMAERMPSMNKRVFKKVKTKDGQEGYAQLPDTVKINHKRRMKRALKRRGSVGVLGYVKAVSDHVKKQDQK